MALVVAASLLSLAAAPTANAGPLEPQDGASVASRLPTPTDPIPTPRTRTRAWMR